MYKEHASIYMNEFGPSQEKHKNQILTQFEPKLTSGCVLWTVTNRTLNECPFHPKERDLIRAENTLPIDLDGWGLGFEHP